MEFPRWQSGLSKTFTISCGSSSLENTVQETAALKSSDQYSCLRLEFDREHPQQDESKSRKLAECIVDILKANASIKSLVIAKGGDPTMQCGAWMHIFEALATVRDHNIERLDVGRPPFDDGETALLARYLTANTTLTTLRIQMTRLRVPIAGDFISQNITSLHLILPSCDASGFQDLGRSLQRCNSISALSVRVQGSSSNHSFFFQGITKMHSLNHFAISTTNYERTPASLIDAIASFVHRHGALETVAIKAYFNASMSDHWAALSSALSYIKSVSFTSVSSNEDSHALAAALQGLACAKRLEVDYDCVGSRKKKFLSMCSVVSRLPNLESISVRFPGCGSEIDWMENAVLELLKTTSSVTKSELELGGYSSLSLSCSFRDQAAYYCFWNNKARFAKLQAGPSGVWPHVVSSLNSSDGRDSIVYQLLLEMPWLVDSSIAE